MNMLAERRPVLEKTVRIAADIVMVNAAWAFAMLTRFVIDIGLQTNGPPDHVLRDYVNEYTASSWLLTLICVAVFHLSGFYTRGRYYQGKYKVLVVAQAVTLSYLAFGFIAFFYRIAGSLPRSVLVLGWILTCGLLVLSRFWSMVWRHLDETPASLPAVGLKSPQSKTQTILVIGGAGYIGSALLPKLLDRGYRVRLLDRFLFGRQPIAGVLDHPDLDIIEADFRHMDKIVQAMNGVDEVIHLGAIVGDPACALDRELTVEVNVIATRMIAEVAKGCGIRRFCFASTCSVYGASDHLLDELSEPNPVSLYAESKLASENVLTQMTDRSFSPAILRFGTVYGQSGRTRFDLVVNLLTAKAFAEGTITVLGGAQWRPFLHVDDAALALVKAVEAPAELVGGEIFNVGSNEQNYRLIEAAQVIQSVIPRANIVDMGPGSDFRNYQVDFTRITRTLGFIPRWTLEEGVRQVLAALERREVTDYQQATYSNVKFLSDDHNAHVIRREMGWVADLIRERERSRAAVS